MIHRHRPRHRTSSWQRSNGIHAPHDKRPSQRHHRAKQPCWPPGPQTAHNPVRVTTVRARPTPPSQTITAKAVTRHMITTGTSVWTHCFTGSTRSKGAYSSNTLLRRRRVTSPTTPAAPAIQPPAPARHPPRVTAALKGLTLPTSNLHTAAAGHGFEVPQPHTTRTRTPARTETLKEPSTTIAWTPSTQQTSAHA